MSAAESRGAGYWSPPVDRQIVFIGYDVLWQPYSRRITGIFELKKSDRLNYKLWYETAREMSQKVMVTSTDRLEKVLADKWLRWSNPS